MATGSYDANGIWNYGEDDNIALFSDTLNMLAESTSDAFTDDRNRLSTLEAGSLSGLIPVVPSSIVVATGTAAVNDIGVVTFTGATAISLNDVFSSDYANYYAVLTSDASSNGFIQIRLRDAGTDNSTANYGSGYFTFTTSGTPTTGGGANSANIGTIGNINTNGFSYGINFFNMRSTTIYKQITAFGMSSLTAVQSMNGFSVNANTFDGFTLIPTAGNITGTIQVFGYND